MIISILASLISVVNPLGAIPVFLSLTNHHTVKERNEIALHTSFYYVLLLSAFFLGGTYILGFFGISINAMRIAGGLVILSSGYGLLQGKFEKSRVDSKVREEAMQKEDISFAPMAMPMLSGPGSISLLIGYYATYCEWSERFTILGVIAISGFLVYLTLRTSPGLNKIMGAAGLKAASRIMGFIVMAIGIQYIISGGVSLIDSIRV